MFYIYKVLNAKEKAAVYLITKPLCVTIYHVNMF